jgi:hypothetical protein
MNDIKLEDGMNARRTRVNSPQPIHEPQRESEGAGPWLRIQLEPFALLFVTHRAEHENFRYIGARGDVEALDQKLLRALATELVGLGRKFSSRTELIDEMWQRITSGFEKVASDRGSAATPVASPDSEQGRPSESASESIRSSLTAQIATLRAAMNAKIAELRAIDGSAKKTGSDTVNRVVALLAGSGATKSELVAKTGAKKGYVDALLGRILPSRGYRIIASRADGAREKMYRMEAAATETRVTSE